jgi:peptide deformylase
LWPEDKTSDIAKVGVVPVGIEVLHQPTRFLGNDAAELGPELGERLLRTMEQANGIGLAANQVGASVRMLAHNLPRAAPGLLLNPVLLEASGQWDYAEGCLSLQVPEVRSVVRRPKVVTVVADLLDGTSIVLRADELLSRVLQHELDHLEGIEYVQRLTGQLRDRVYDVMVGAGVAVKCLPFRPYSHFT